MIKISLYLINNISSDSFISEIILFVQKLGIHIFNFILNINNSNNYNVIYFTFSFTSIIIRNIFSFFFAQNMSFSNYIKSNFNSFIESTIFNSFNYLIVSKVFINIL